MTEADWLASDDPERMVAAVADGAFRAEWPDAARTARKRTLFGAACCRLVWPLVAVDERCRRAVEYYEIEFDEPMSLNEVDELTAGVKAAAEHPDDGTPALQVAAANLVYDAAMPQSAVGYLLRGFDEWGDPCDRACRVADLLRCVLGNPFRPVVFASAWLTPTAVAVARAIYDARSFRDLPILADALQDGGCDDAAVLGHCRGGDHVRGCWVVDLVLGKQ